MTVKEIISLKKTDCTCKRIHKSCLDDVLIGSGVLNNIAEAVKRYNAKRPFVISDINTYEIAGKRVCALLEKSGVSCISYTLPEKAPKPDEKRIGSIMMHYDLSCDIIIGVGSGVINDLGKMLAAIADKPYIIVATAPSMDGYASSTSSMDRGGLKVSLNSRCANLIIGDLDLLKNAPLKMLKAGLGDMLAKYTSLCEWRISHSVTGEYYCEYVASLVRYATQKCVNNAMGLLSRDEESVRAVFEGLVISGIAMNFAGVSRPASGVEHYFSHLWDMRALEFGSPSELHGLQCASGFVSATRVYEKLKKLTPERKKALDFTKSFDVDAWNAILSKYWGHSSTSMIAVGEREKRYDLALHEQRLDIIIEKWDEILAAIDEELIPINETEALVKTLDFPDVPSELSIDRELLTLTFKATKDIRAKYILSMLLWDIGELDNEALLSAL